MTMQYTLRSNMCVGTAAWQNSVSSILSANPDLFASGQLVVKQSGWWTLAAHSPPIPDGMSIDISDEILHPRSTGTDSTQMSISEPQQRKSELLQRLQSIDPEILKAALAQSKRSVASIQKRMKIDSAATAVATSTAMEEAPVVTKKEAPAKREAAKKESPLKKAKRPSEEDEQLRLIESMPLPDDPAERVRRARLRRKLLHHKAQRAAGESIVDLKARLQQLSKPGAPFLFIGTHELDEYGIPLRDDPDDDCDPARLLEADIPFLRNPMLSIKARLLGASAIYNPYPPLRLWDPYGARHISLYIHRDERTCPPRLAVLRRICGETHPIDCCLLRPEWIGALNRFLSSLFWPGIDVSESLEYPELCILAMHRQLIVGAAVMNPEGYIAYIGVHPEWRNQGLSRRMLAYLLNRSSIRLNVDATVHVSVDNPAMLLYQQMGFKLEYYVYNHYDTFYDSSDATRVRAVSEDSQAPRDGVYWRERHSKHAFLLRFFRDGYRRAALCKP